MTGADLLLLQAALLNRPERVADSRDEAFEFLAAAHIDEVVSYELDEWLTVKVYELSDGPHAPRVCLTGYFNGKGQLVRAELMYDGNFVTLFTEPKEES